MKYSIGESGLTISVRKKIAVNLEAVQIIVNKLTEEVYFPYLLARVAKTQDLRAVKVLHFNRLHNGFIKL